MVHCTACRHTGSPDENGFCNDCGSDELVPALSPMASCDGCLGTGTLQHARVPAGIACTCVDPRDPDLLPGTNA